MDSTVNIYETPKFRLAENYVITEFARVRLKALSGNSLVEIIGHYKSFFFFSYDIFRWETWHGVYRVKLEIQTQNHLR